MKLNWKWIVGILIFVVLLVEPFVWQLFVPYNGYGSMMKGYGYGMPMMGYGYGMTPFHGALPFGMLFMWLFPLGLLVLIVLGIIWLVKQLLTKSS